MWLLSYDSLGPDLGLKNKESEFAKQAGCEFCYLVVPSSSRSPKNPIFKLTKTGKYQMDLTCMYPPNVGSRCPTGYSLSEALHAVSDYKKRSYKKRC